MYSFAASLQEQKDYGTYSVNAHERQLTALGRHTAVQTLCWCIAIAVPDGALYDSCFSRGNSGESEDSLGDF
jgi:hypothetical protein